ncbi:ABC transporter permease subunit [candidate division KSB3 bacterium]|uniref:ABC transporter permease subunit n=1 Tax=candidate division KSB3 bacterium TaxID=2044937 RepID=A0A9D5JXT1_9BACT|nr:ABC transporter permease subunit [candidate division KSB3 bacterium]MBD3325926.1 ABC transporter permease subunit [candidate division KSB3 bacterium]
MEYKMDPKLKRRLSKIVITLILMTFTFILLIPFFWVILMSVRTTGEILRAPYGLPTEIRWQNYYQLMFDPQIKFYRYFLNSLMVTGGALVLTLTLSCLGGYGFGRRRFQFKYRGLLLILLLFSLMLPRQAMYIPQFVMMSKYGLLNTRTALILLYTAFAVTMSTYLMQTYFSQLPEEFEESARIDGANDWQIFWHIMLPLARPVIATLVIFNFMYFWNELLIALTMVTKSELRTLPLAMMNFIGENRADYGMGAASLVVGMAPVLILYVALSERFVQGMTAGAIKG